jgi:hypothetical protein
LSTGVASTIAGSTPGMVDAVGTGAQFNLPTGMARWGDNLYVADHLNHRICANQLSTGQVSPLAGSTQGFQDAIGATAQFNNPTRLVEYNNSLYVADRLNHRIRVIQLSTGQVSTSAPTIS